MNKIITNVNIIRYKIQFGLNCFVLIFMLLFTLHANAQPTSWVNEGFGASPYPATPNYYLSNGANSWTEGEISGTVSYPNAWTYTIQGGVPATYKTTMGGFIQGTPLAAVSVANHGSFAGTGYLQYNNRSINYPNTTNVAPIGDTAYIATRSLDFSGRTAFNPADTFGFWFYRDACVAGGVNAINDAIVVYINTSPTMQGPNLVKLTENNTLSNFIPRSSTIAPLQAGSGWRRCTYTIPNIPAYSGAGTATSTAYIIVVGCSASGNNMFLDDFTLPEWQTPMTVQIANVYYQENADVDKNTTGNLIMGVKITTKGSSSPLKIDAATFSAAGSTFYSNDVQNPLVYYTGAAANFTSTGGPVQMPVNVASLPGGGGLLNFGWYAAGCPVLATPVGMQLSPGSENYIWLTYDIKSTATVGNFVGADFQYITSKPAGVCTYIGSSTSTLLPPPILPQTLGKARQIGATYPIPTYTGGLGVPGFWDFDCVSAVFLQGDNGTLIENYFHDDSCSGCHSVHPLGDPQHIYCIRWACHPNDYTNFKPENQGNFKKRGIVQVTTGKGVRTATAPYLLRAMVGTVTNRIAAFIDWNKDGDFDDRYTGTTGIPAQDVAILENLGTQIGGAGGTALTQFPVTVWPSGSLFSIHVPQLGDAVLDLNDPNQLPNNSIGPIAISTVRMRIRTSINAVTIGPFTNGYTEGETEDYTVQVLDNCPPPGYNICKWIGSSNDWNTPSNWCPAVPTINDMAYIGIVSGTFFYPTINSNTAAVCRQLKLMDNGTGTGAKLNIDASVNSSLVVADDIIIGQNAPAAGSSAGVSVRSDFSKTITIPGKGSVPPAGVAIQQQTPFRNNAQAKTQISYTAAELGTTYGWRAGDIVDQISIEVNSISGGAGASTYQNLRIQAFLTNAPVTYPFPVPANTKIAVAAGDMNVVAGWPKTVFPSTTITLNMPWGALGCNTGCANSGNYYTFNLTPNTLIWDGVSNLVLSFEYNSTVGLAPAKNYILYDESNSVFSVLSVNFPTVGGPITGYNIDGAGHWTGGIGPASPVISAIVSNQRPRLDFNYHRPYQRFDLTVGGKILNNNSKIRTTPYSITPVYGIPGDSGFVGGYSKVIFNPTIRSTVSTPVPPGLTNANFWNPTPQGATLVTDIDQEITSANNASTVFNNLEINKVSATGKVVKQNSTTLSLIGAYADTLILTNGELNLNRKEFTLQKADSICLARTNGWIRSEDNTAPAGNIQSKFSWNIGSNTGTNHDIPFGTASANVFPFRLNLSTGDVGKVTVGTYGTPQNNTAYPTLPTPVTAMTSQGMLAVDWTVDRFWYVKRTTTLPITGNLRFNYPVAEGTAQAAYSAGNMKAQRWENLGAGWGWHPPYLGQSDGNPGPTWVNHDAQYISDVYNMWTVVSLFNGQTPLPLQLLNFDARLMDNKVKLWWDVMSEKDVAKYKIERTSDYNNFSLISTITPRGPSNSMLNYESYDFNPLKGWQYYRLATLNENGTVDYSELKSVNIKNIFEIISVNAENTSGSIKIDFSYDSQLPYTYTVTDMFGKVISAGNNKADIGYNSLEIPAHLAKGIYFISLSNTQKVLTQKLVY